MGDDGDEVAATMKDLKELKSSLTSLVDTRMDELRELLTKLGSAQATTPPASSAHNDNSSEKVNVEDEEADDGDTGTKEDEDKANEKPKPPKKSSSPTKNPNSGDRSLCSGTLPGRGSAPGAISIDATSIFLFTLPIGGWRFLRDFGSFIFLRSFMVTWTSSSAILTLKRLSPN